MLFRQLFEQDSSTCTYLVAERGGGEALLIDPVKSALPQYLQLYTPGHTDDSYSFVMKDRVFTGGWTVSTIGEERAHNPRLKVRSKAEYTLMQGLRLPNPKLMDVAVPANLACGAA